MDAKDFYCSTPKSFIPDKFNEVYVTLIVQKKEYDEKGIIDGENFGDEDLLDSGIFDFMIDLDGNGLDGKVFELTDIEIKPIKKQKEKPKDFDINTKSEDLKLRLQGKGFIHNPSLDPYLDSWIKEYKSKNEEYKKPPEKNAGKRSAAQTEFNPKISGTTTPDKTPADEKTHDDSGD